MAILAALPIKLALATGTDLSPDEAYYLGAARLDGVRPRLVDHPPMVVWLSGLGDRLPALPLELRVRLPFVALSVALTLACVAVADRRGGGPRGRSLVALATSFGLLPMVGGFLATPDVPALLAVVAALGWAVPQAGPSRPRHAVATIAAGIAIALGALSKVVVLPLAVAIAVAARSRSTAARIALLVPMVLAYALLAPSLTFQLRHAFGAGAVDPAGAFAALAAAASAQVLLWSPWLLARGVVALRRAPTSPESLVVAALTVLVAISAVVRATPPEPNWWAPAALALVIAAGARTDEATKQAANRAAELADRARPAIVAWLAAPTLLAAAHALHPFLPLPTRADPTARLHGWRSARPPLDAPGVGPYASAAERCANASDCADLRLYFDRLNRNQ